MEDNPSMALCAIILELRKAAALLNALGCQYSSDGVLTDEENALAHNAIYDLFCRAIDGLDALTEMIKP